MMRAQRGLKNGPAALALGLWMCLSCGCGSDEAGAEAAAPASSPQGGSESVDPPAVTPSTSEFRVRGRVVPATTDKRVGYRVVIRNKENVEEPPTNVDVYGDGAFRSRPLAKHPVVVSCRLPIALGGPAFHVHHEVDGRQGGVHDLLIRAPEGKARLLLKTADETPAFLLFLTPRGVRVPTRFPLFRAWMKDDVGPSDVLFSARHDGKGDTVLPRLPAGPYTVWLASNEVRVGGPPPEIRSVDVDLADDAPCTLVLSQGLAAVSVETGGGPGSGGR